MKLLRQTILEIVLVILCIFLSIRARGFLSAENLLKILGDVSMQGIIAFGMTMVIIAGEIDLSVGSTVAFAGCVTAWVVERLTNHGVGMGVSIALGMAAAIAASVVSGVLSGFFRMRFRVPTFISTLAWMAILRGVAAQSSWIVHGFPINRRIRRDSAFWIGGVCRRDHPVSGDHFRGGLFDHPGDHGVYDVWEVGLCRRRE